MEPQKRRFVRKRTDQLLYAELGSDNGSILLNLSEEGFSFQSIAPVREEELRFTLSVGDGRKLAGVARMAWTDTTKKMGGLSFLNPSPELRRQVREWLDETPVTVDGDLDACMVNSEAKRRRKKLREEARLGAEKVLRGQTVQPSGGDARANDRWANGAAQAETAKAVSVGETAGELASPVHRRPAGSWRGVRTIVCAALLFLGLAAYRREVGHLVMSLGSSIAGEEQKSDADAAMEVRPAPHNADADAKPASLPDEGYIKEPRVEAAPVSNEQLTPSTNQPMEYAKRNSALQTGLSEDVPSLWTSVETGDTHAEVVLANRYIRGDGVPQSCAQARVLLEAAVKRGSAEAKQKLDGLAQAGCP
jgi:hypothetical protein